MSTANTFRLLTVSLGGVTIAMVSLVFYVYMLAWRRSPRRRGLIPCHVLGVSVYTVLSQGLLMTLLAERSKRDEPLSYYGAGVLVADMVLIGSLTFIYRYDRRRVSAAMPVDGDPDGYPLRRAEDRAPRERRWWGRRHKAAP